MYKARESLSVLRSVLVSILTGAFILGYSPLAKAEQENITGDVVYFQDMKEFEPRQWKDGSLHGGIAYLATALDQARDEFGDPVVAFGGDLVGGSLFGSVFRGVPFVDALNELGVDVGNFGNHDFDYGLDHTRQLIDRAQFPWISSNLITTDGAPVSEDGTTFVAESGDLRIGFIALSGGLDRTIAAKDVLEGDLIESARQSIARVMKQDVDAIVLLSQVSEGKTTEVMETFPELGAALREEDSAQSLESVTYTGDGRPIVAPRADYGTLVHLGVTVHSGTGETSVTVENIEVGPSLPANSQWEQRVQDLYLQLESDLSEVVGTSSSPLTKAELGPIVADAYRDHFGTQLGWQNGGGQRADLDQGPITLAEILSILPFGNSPLAISVTGAQIKDALEKGIESNPSGSNGFPRPAGFDFTFDTAAPAGERVRTITLDNGTPMDMEATYTLAISNYVVGGGDKVDSFLNAPVIAESDALDADIFTEYIRAKGTIPAPTAGVPPTDVPSSSSLSSVAQSSSPALSSAGTIIFSVVAAILGMLGVLALVPPSIKDHIQAMVDQALLKFGL